jgi:2-keto-3-deoxy-L-rhamnonate aldolase RhmA
MRVRWILTMAAVTLPAPAFVNAQQQHRVNPVIDLLERGKPVFGVYAPSNRRGRPGGPGQPAVTSEAPRTPAQLAREALAYAGADYVFDGSMEDEFDRAFPIFAEFVKGMREAGAVSNGSVPRLHHPLMVKMHRIAPDPGLAAEHIGRQLNLGVSGIVFVGVESADEVRAGLAAMRFTSQGGTRSDDVGDAPALWGMTPQQYREKADLWPLHPQGELVNWTIVESREGLARVREIAAVKGIGVLFPGAGTLRGLFTTTDASGQRRLDEQGWEAAIQQVLAACKEFKVPCGYPANANDIEMRMRQGFSVFVINWGEPGFKAVEVGRKAAGR